MIKKVAIEELKDCYEVILESFRDVMDELNITRENCSGFSGFLRYEKLLSQVKKGLTLYGWYEPDLIGCIGLLTKSSARTQIKYLCVLKTCRHQGIGMNLIHHVENMTSGRLQLGMIYENTVLFRWYESLGFQVDKIVPYRSKVFHIAFMEKTIEKLQSENI